jgi:hypothetical protein
MNRSYLVRDNSFFLMLEVVNGFDRGWSVLMRLISRGASKLKLLDLRVRKLRVLLHCLFDLRLNLFYGSTLPEFAGRNWVEAIRR